MHRPLRIQFVLTSLPIGGAETLLLNLIRQLDRENFEAEVVCLKEEGELGPAISEFAPVHSGFLANKWDVGVLWRLAKHFHQSKADAVITIGAGDKMFWGRLAAKLARIPVICSALHSTGWPDGVGKLNRLLTGITSGFIAVASDHARFMIECEKFPKDRVFMIPNGVDTSRFVPDLKQRTWLRKEIGVADTEKLVGIVAALRSEKNHLQLIESAEIILKSIPDTHFVIVGDGPERTGIERAISERGLNSSFSLLGSRDDTERILAALDVFCLTSRNEANPVSILEALSCGIPVVAPKVGSIHETVLEGRTGFLTEPLCPKATSASILTLLKDPELASQFGKNGRELVVKDWSLKAMVNGYQSLVETLYNQTATRNGKVAWSRKERTATESLTTEKDCVTATLFPAASLMGGDSTTCV